MSAIPADIMRLAEAAQREWAAEDYRSVLLDVLARVILVERSRCAAQACDPEKTYGSSRGLEYLSGYVQGRTDAREAILGPTPTEKTGAAA